MIDVIMPKMGESITEGTIIEWNKKIGDKTVTPKLLITNAPHLSWIEKKSALWNAHVDWTVKGIWQTLFEERDRDKNIAELRAVKWTEPIQKEIASRFFDELEFKENIDKQYGFLTENYTYDSGVGVLITARQRGLLEDSKKCLSLAIEQVNLNMGLDIVASTLHGFVLIIKEVVGEVPDKEILQNIFSNFCIGK